MRRKSQHEDYSYQITSSIAKEKTEGVKSISPSNIEIRKGADK